VQQDFGLTPEITDYLAATEFLRIYAPLLDYNNNGMLTDDMAIAAQINGFAAAFYPRE
jgi:hypothetical protein